MPQISFDLTNFDASLALAAAGRVLERSALQFAAFFGAVAIAAAALTWLSKLAGNLHRQFAWPKMPLYLLGGVGVPAHELAHAFFCLVFGHEVRRVKLFDPSGAGGAQGSVEHAYERRNLRHRVGQLFIGAAPALVGPVAVAALFLWLAPSARSVTWSDLAASWKTSPFILARSFAHPANWSALSFWFFVYLAAGICSQIELSREDLAHARAGAVATAIVVLAANGLISIVSGLADAAWAERFHAHAIAWGERAAQAWCAIAALSILASAATLFLTWAGMSVVHLVLRRPPLNPFRP